MNLIFGVIAKVYTFQFPNLATIPRMRTRPVRWKSLFFAASLMFTFGCRVPLKTPPISMDGAVPKINWVRLEEFATASRAAYQPAADIEKTYGAEHVVIRALPAGDSRYFIYFDHKNRTQTVSVRGTTSKANAWSDFNSIKVPDSGLGIYLHRGFKSAADDIYTDMRPFLQKDYKTRATGHSLGGAIAAILMLNLARDGFNVEQVLTFGQPKITNEQGAARAPQNFIRIVNDGDVVTQIPPSTIVYDLSGAYYHFGPEIILNADGTYLYRAAHRPRDILAGDLWKTIQPQDVADHFIQSYIDRIAAKPKPAKPL
jgi:hypothetical protein